LAAKRWQIGMTGLATVSAMDIFRVRTVWARAIAGIVRAEASTALRPMVDVISWSPRFGGTLWGQGRGRQASAFFFEKKNQKTFITKSILLL